MSFICHIHNYTEYNEEWNVFSAFNPSKCTHLEQWAADCAAPGEQSWTSYRSRDSNPQPWVTSGFKSNALSIRPTTALWCSMVRRVQIWHSCWKSRTPCPLGYRGGRPSNVSSEFSSKASISDGMGVHMCIRNGQLACFGRHYECWKVYKGFRATYRATCSPPDNVYFSRTMHNHILQQLQQHSFIVEETGCWTGLPAVQIFHL